MAMTISGIGGGNYYLVNNPIYVHLEGLTDDKVKLLIIDAPDTLLSVDLVGRDGAIDIDISPYLKTQFPRISFDKDGQFLRFNFSYFMQFDSGTDHQFIKNRNFIRGGRITQDTNVHLEDGDVLYGGDILPFWDGFPNDLWKIVGNQLVSDSAIGERRLPVKNCDRVFIRFINRLGGVSHWLFEAYEKNIKGGGTDYVLNNEGFQTLGNSYSEDITIKSVFSYEYISIAEELPTSPLVEMYHEDTETWEKIRIRPGGIKTNSFDNSYELSFVLERLHRYNQSIKW